MAVKTLIAVLAAASSAVAGVIDTNLVRRQATSVDQCPGYIASNVQKSGDQIVGADLTLAGTACNAYGTDLQNLKLQVEYQTSTLLPP